MLKPDGDWSKVNFGEASSAEEYFLLYGIAALMRPRTMLEIGTSTGIGAAALISGAGAAVDLYDSTKHNMDRPPDPHLTTIDIEKKDCVLLNFSALNVSARNVEFIIGDSRVVVPELAKQGKRYDLVFIDGCHLQEFAVADWKNTQKLTDFWILHDSTQMAGVRYLVAQIRKSNEFDVVEFSRYPFGRQFHPKRGGLFVKGTIPGITLVRRRGTHQEVGAGELKWLSENKK